MTTGFRPCAVIPTFDNPPSGTVPFTSVDVSSSGIVVTPGEVLAIALFDPGAGTPPWTVWRMGQNSYSRGTAFGSPDTGASWGSLLGGTEDGGAANA